MNIVGLDLSLRATGVGLPSGDTTVLSSKRKGIERIIDLQIQVRDILRTSLDGMRIPGLVVIEGYAFGSGRGSHAHELGELGGSIKVMLTNSDVLWTTVPPAVVKKFATGRGNADKTAMAVAAVKANGHEFTDDNECDAWWLHTMGMYRFAQEVFGEGALYGVAHTAYRDEAVSKVDWPPPAATAPPNQTALV